MPDKICELVSFTHQRCDTLVSDNERVVVTGNARSSVGPSTLLSHSEYCQLRQRRAYAGSALLALDWHWHSGGHTVTALSTLAVSAASARCMPTSMLCNIQLIHDGWPREGGLWGGGGVGCTSCVYIFVFTVHRICTRTPVLHGHADR